MAGARATADDRWNGSVIVETNVFLQPDNIDWWCFSRRGMCYRWGGHGFSGFTQCGSLSPVSLICKFSYIRASPCTNLYCIVLHCSSARRFLRMKTRYLGLSTSSNVENGQELLWHQPLTVPPRKKEKKNRKQSKQKSEGEYILSKTVRHGEKTRRVSKHR